MLHRYFKVCKSRVSMTHAEFILEKSRIYICTYANHWICVFLQIPAPVWAHWGPLLKQKMYRYDKFAFMWILETLEQRFDNSTQPLVHSYLQQIKHSGYHEFNGSTIHGLQLTRMEFTSSAVSLNLQICSFRARVIWACTCLCSGQSWLFVLVITYTNGTKVIQCSHIHKSDSSQKQYFVVCVYILRESANDMTRSTTIADINCLTSHMDIMPLLISKCPNWTQSYFRSRAWSWWNPGHAHKKLQRLAACTAIS
jgi:hypothetical protein